MSILIKILSFFIFVLFSHSQTTYKKILNDVDPNAKCLDGTSPFFYLHEGSQPKNILIFFIGGGLCSGMDLNSAIEDCYQRSKTELGSSIPWPEELSGTNMGILETNPEKSRFAQWTKIVAGYCDGSLHQGYRENPINYKNTSLYFRGAANSRAIFTWLTKYKNLANASQLVISGGSAGGIASYLWGNYAASLLSDPKKVIIIPDSGVFLKYSTYKTDVKFIQTMVQNNFALANLDEKSPFKICNQKYPGQQYQCIFIENSFLEISPRTLLITSEYDSWVINNTLNIRCLIQGSSGQTLKKCTEDQLDYIESYRNKFLGFLQMFLSLSRNSAWSIGCSNHGYTFDDFYYNSPNQTVNGSPLKQVVQKFVFEQARIQSTDQKWPSNQGCSF